VRRRAGRTPRSAPSPASGPGSGSAGSAARRRTSHCCGGWSSSAVDARAFEDANAACSKAAHTRGDYRSGCLVVVHPPLSAVSASNHSANSALTSLGRSRWMKCPTRGSTCWAPVVPERSLLGVNVGIPAARSWRFWSPHLDDAAHIDGVRRTCPAGQRPPDGGCATAATGRRPPRGSWVDVETRPPLTEKIKPRPKQAEIPKPGVGLEPTTPSLPFQIPAIVRWLAIPGLIGGA
jgi:hypothetical protein